MTVRPTKRACIHLSAEMAWGAPNSIKLGFMLRTSSEVRFFQIARRSDLHRLRREAKSCGGVKVSDREFECWICYLPARPGTRIGIPEVPPDWIPETLPIIDAARLGGAVVALAGVDNGVAAGTA
jgi:hypothetical protein